MKRALAPLAFLVLVPLLGVTSCASVFSEYCDKQANCRGGNDKDRAACADELRGQEKAASDYGCADQFDAEYTCRNNTASCVNGKFEAQNCGPQGDALDNCIKANSARR